MKAAFFDTSGTPEVICAGELPKPAPKDNGLLVRALAASVNPIDTYIRSGSAQRNVLANLHAGGHLV